jgi:hypothetical protein
LLEGTWVRSDVVTGSGNCAELPAIEWCQRCTHRLLKQASIDPCIGIFEIRAVIWDCQSCAAIGIRAYKVPLFVAEYQAPHEQGAKGNVYFLERGAIPIQKNQKTGRANIDGLVRAVEDKQANIENITEKPVQLSLLEPEISWSKTPAQSPTTLPTPLHTQNQIVCAIAQCESISFNGISTEI